MIPASLSEMFRSWTLRLRVQRALNWAVRGLAAALGAALVVGIAGLLQASLLRAEFLMLAGASIPAGILAGALAFLWPIDPHCAARYFDRAFELQERISTALELASQPAGPGQMLRRQLEDAAAAAARVNARRALPLRLIARDALALTIVALMLGAIWFGGQGWFQAALQRRAEEAAVEAQAQRIEEILTQIESNPALTDEQKLTLSEPLQQALERLESGPSLEGAVSVLTRSGERLVELSSSQAGQTAEALRDAGQMLAGQPGSPLQAAGQNLAEGDTIGAAAQLRDLEVDGLSSGEARETADQLEALAEALGASDPQLAAQLSQAARALRESDAAEARRALNQAARSMARAGQQVIFSEAATQAGEQLLEGAGQVLAAGGGQQTARPPEVQGGQANGAGDGHDPGSTSQGSESSDAPIPHDNGPGDGGDNSYEQIHAPSLLGGADGAGVAISRGGEDATVIGQVGEAAAGAGRSLVPYEEVYPAYDDFNQQAIEHGRVPVEFLEVVRNYFDSIRP